MENCFIERSNGQDFDWVSWTNGSICEMFGHRLYDNKELILNRDKIRKYAIKWCPGEKVPCRPKEDTIAVMFEMDDLNRWWTHFTYYEFDICFPGERK